MAHNKPLEMYKNAIYVTNARGCFKLFVKSTLYGTIILCGRCHQKGIKLEGRDFFRRRRGNAIVGIAEFFSADFRQESVLRLEGSLWCTGATRVAQVQYA